MARIMDAEWRRAISEGLKRYYRTGKEYAKDATSYGVTKVIKNRDTRERLVHGARTAKATVKTLSGSAMGGGVTGGVFGGAVGAKINSSVANSKIGANLDPKVRKAIKFSADTGKVVKVGRGRYIVGGLRAGAKFGAVGGAAIGGLMLAGLGGAGAYYGYKRGPDQRSKTVVNSMEYRAERFKNRKNKSK